MSAWRGLVAADRRHGEAEKNVRPIRQAGKNAGGTGEGPRASERQIGIRIAGMVAPRREADSTARPPPTVKSLLKVLRVYTRFRPLPNRTKFRI